MKRDRKELSSLKRENQRLRKLLAHFENLAEAREEASQDDESQPIETTPSKAKKKRPDGKQRRKPQTEPQPGGKRCPQCNSTTEIAPIGPYEYRFCSDRCGYREKMK